MVQRLSRSTVVIYQAVTCASILLLIYLAVVVVIVDDNMNDCIEMEFVDLESKVDRNRPVQIDNSISSFTTHLNDEIIFNDNDDIGLVSLTFQKNWYTFDQDQNVEMRCDPDADVAKPDKLPFIPLGFYKNVDDVLKLLVKIFEDVYKPLGYETVPSLRFDERTQKIAIKPALWKKSFALPVFDKELAQFLGFSSFDEYRFLEQLNVWKKMKNETGSFEVFAPEVIDLTVNRPCLYLYCNLVQPNLVANRRLRLLQRISVPNVEFGSVVNITFDEIQYKKAVAGRHRLVHIDLCDHTGRIVRFRAGRLSLTLAKRTQLDGCVRRLLFKAN